MKKLTLFFLSLLACGLAFQACDNTKTYAEMLEEEKDAIKAFIKDNNIKVYPKRSFTETTRLRIRLRMNMCNLPAAYICKYGIKALKILLIQ